MQQPQTTTQSSIKATSTHHDVCFINSLMVLMELFRHLCAGVCFIPQMSSFVAYVGLSRNSRAESVSCKAGGVLLVCVWGHGGAPRQERCFFSDSVYARKLFMPRCACMFAGSVASTSELSAWVVGFPHYCNCNKSNCNRMSSLGVPPWPIACEAALADVDISNDSRFCAARP